jgi:phosphate transport system protein
MTHQDHLRHHYGDLLESVRSAVVRLGALVLENARRASEALLENSRELADEVLAADDEVDDRYAAVEREVMLVMARQQPVASDLRFLISMIRVSYELERSGDLAVNCAKALKRTDGFHMSPALRGIFAQMCAQACDLFAAGIDSLSEMYADAGYALDEADDVVDDLVGQFYSGIAAESNQIGLQNAIELSRIGRYMERIADHGVNLGDHVTYIMTGEFPHHAKPGGARDEVKD